MTAPALFEALVMINGGDLDDFCAPMPDPEGLRAALLTGEGMFAQVYAPETSRDHWVGSDGKHARCWILVGLTEEQSDEVRVLFDAKTGPRGVVMKADILIPILEEVLGEPLTTITYN